MTRGSRSSVDRHPDSPGVSASTVRTIEAYLAKREARRERLHDEARALRRRSQGVMIRLHAGTADRMQLADLRIRCRALARRVAREGAPDAPLTRDALQEAVEALLLGAAIGGARFPTPREIGVDVEPYLLGLGDVVGELRRRALSALAEDHLHEAETWLSLMEQITQTLMRFDTTRAIVPLKPKQDTARSLLERTRGEVVMAQISRRHRRPPGTSTEEP